MSFPEKNQSALKKNETFTFSPPTNLEESKHYVPAFFKHAKGNHPRFPVLKVICSQWWDL